MRLESTVPIGTPSESYTAASTPQTLSGAKPMVVVVTPSLLVMRMLPPATSPTTRTDSDVGRAVSGCELAQAVTVSAANATTARMRPSGTGRENGYDIRPVPNGVQPLAQSRAAPILMRAGGVPPSRTRQARSS